MTSVAHDEQLLDINGITLCARAFGDPAAPTMPLIGGAEASMDWVEVWDTAITEFLGTSESSR